MRKLLLAFALLSLLAAAQTTPRLRLNIPNDAAPGRNGLVNDNFNMLDGYLSGGLALPGLRVGDPGHFTASQMNEYLQSILNGCSPATEWHVTQRTYATDALTGCVTAPSSATAQANAIAGYAVSGSGAPAVGGFFQGYCANSNCSVWGLNAVAQDVAGISGGFLIGVDVNINPQNPRSSYRQGVAGVGVTLTSANVGNYGNGFGCDVTTPIVGTWTACYVSQDQGTAQAFVAGSQPGIAPQPSQNFYLYHRDGGNTLRLSSMFIDNVGDYVLNPYSGNVAIQGKSRGLAELYFNNNTAQHGYSFPDATGIVGVNLNATNGLYQSKRNTAGCTTAASAGGVCASAVTVTWPSPFADTNYSVTCTGYNPAGTPSAPYIVASYKSVGSIAFNYFAITPTASSYETVDCIAVHD